jgi:hypothetical protein
MDKLNVYICGCIRNSGQYVRPVFENIKKVAVLFNKVHIIISYDESTDNTLIELENQRQYFGAFDIIINRNPLTPWRTVNIGNARNRIIYKIRELQQEKRDAAGWKYFIMLDMDDVCSQDIHLDVLTRQFQPDKLPLWDSVSFHRSDYYDIWALSLYPYMFSCWHYKNPKLAVDYLTKMMNSMLDSMGSDELLPCHSAFCGFAIYKCDPFIKCTYDGHMNLTYMREEWIKSSREAFPYLYLYGTTQEELENSHTNVDCEHRTFHLEAVEKHGAVIAICAGKLFTEPVAKQSRL